MLSDLLDEPTETYNVLLSSPVGATIADGTGVGTILDNDPTPTLSINDVTTTEGNDGGSTPATFTVSLSAASGNTVTVTVNTANVTATAGSDYTAVTATTVTIPAGQTSATVTVPVLGDLVDEPNETYNVLLTNPVGATISDGTGVGTIVDDDDPTRTLSINDVSTPEVDTGTTQATFTITMSSSAPTNVTVQAMTGNLTATAGLDYTGRSLTTLTIPAGQTTVAFPVTIIGDWLDEADETYNVLLSNAAGATIADGTGLGTILDGADICTIVGDKELPTINDTLTGTTGNDVICGLTGDDVMMVWVGTTASSEAALWGTVAMTRSRLQAPRRQSTPPCCRILVLPRDGAATNCPASKTLSAPLSVTR